MVVVARVDDGHRWLLTTEWKKNKNVVSRASSVRKIYFFFLVCVDECNVGFCEEKEKREESWMNGHNTLVFANAQWEKKWPLLFLFKNACFLTFYFLSAFFIVTILLFLFSFTVTFIYTILNKILWLSLIKISSFFINKKIFAFLFLVVAFWNLIS
jgi:hypothetical protein